MGFRSHMGRGNFKGGKRQPVPKYSSYAVSCTKMAEAIEMPFGIWTQVGPRKHVLHGGAYWHHLANAIELSMFGGPAKMAEPIEMLFGVWTRVGPRSH